MNEKIVAIISIALAGIIGTYLGHNGYLLAAAIAAIAGLAGYKPPATK